MKQLFSIILIFSSFASFSESIPRDIWVVKSDEKEATVKSNLCLITGNAYEAFSETGIEGGIISNLSRTNSCKTDENGNFSLTISSLDTAIFFYHESYVEIVCWKYEFKGGHHVVMDFICSEKLPDGMMYMEEKPVIYAYSNKTINADISLSNVQDLTFTYPQYNDGWCIEIDPESGISFDGKNYPYLFWEGEKNNLNFSSDNGVCEGFFIQTDTAITFFENSLYALGLNQKESTDFITYWAPRIERYDYATIQFLIDDQYDNTIGELIVSPKPDAKRRVYLLFEGGNSERPDISLIQPELTGFKREGFTIVEWGGTELTNPFKF